MRGLGFSAGWGSGHQRGTPARTDSGYPGHNMVTFHHDSLVYQNSPVANWLPASATQMFLAMKLRAMEYREDWSNYGWGLFNIGEGLDGHNTARFAVSLSGADGASNRTPGSIFVNLNLDIGGLLPPVWTGWTIDAIPPWQDCTVHISIDCAAPAPPEPDETTPGNNKTIATFNVPYTDGSIIYRGGITQKEGVDYTVLQRTPVAKLKFVVPFTTWEVAFLSDGFAGGLKIWFNGVRQKIEYLNGVPGASIPLSSNARADIANRAVIGQWHHFASVPNYTLPIGIGAINAGASDEDVETWKGVQMGFVLFDAMKNEDPSTTSNNGRDISLARFAKGGSTPALILLGGLQTYSAPEWNSGINLGTAPITFSQLAT